MHKEFTPLQCWRSRSGVNMFWNLGSYTPTPIPLQKGVATPSTPRIDATGHRESRHLVLFRITSERTLSATACFSALAWKRQVNSSSCVSVRKRWQVSGLCKVERTRKTSNNCIHGDKAEESLEKIESNECWSELSLTDSFISNKTCMRSLLKVQLDISRSIRCTYLRLVCD